MINTKGYQILLDVNLCIGVFEKFCIGYLPKQIGRVPIIFDVAIYRQNLNILILYIATGVFAFRKLEDFWEHFDLFK